MLVGKLSADDVTYVMNVVLVKLNDYEVTDRCTEIAVIDDSDEVLLKNFIGCVLIEGKSKNTVRTYGYVIKAMARKVGKHLIDITTNDLRVWIANEMLSGKQKSYVSLERNCVNAFYKWAKNEGYIAENPCEPINAIKKPHVERKSFSDEDIDALRSACKKPIERALIEFLLSSGVRNEECCNMLVSDVDFSRLTVFVRGGKGNKDRVAYISPVCKKYLLKYLKSRNSESNLLFLSQRSDGDEPFSNCGISRMIKRIAKRADVDNAHPHRFRRTLATTLAKRGMPIQEIQRVLGHTDIKTTQRYIDTDRTNVEASYRKYVA